MAPGRRRRPRRRAAALRAGRGRRRCPRRGSPPAACYVLARPAADAWALVSGTVWDVAGSSPAYPSRVDATGGLLQLTAPAGTFAIAAPAGGVTLAATHLDTANRGERLVQGAAGVAPRRPGRHASVSSRRA